MKKHGSTIFLIIFLVLLLIPSVGMLVFGPSESENGEELVMPVLYSEEEGLNREYLSQLSDVFEQRFALRKQLVTAYSYISENVFGVSAQSGVIVGTDGWLFFNDTLADYQRTNVLTDRQLHNVGRHLELIDEYCADNDAVYYFRRDSHWNNMGAAIATDCILDMAGIPHHEYTFDAYYTSDEHMGDLDQMIHPSNTVAETDLIFENMPQFTYITEVESNFDPRIETTGTGDMSLLMYRDSFGSALLPFMCTSPSRLPAPSRILPENAVQIEVSDLNIAEAGDFVTVTGTLPEGCYTDDSLIYIQSGDSCFEAYPVSDLATGSEGFMALLEKISVSTDNIMVFIV